MKLLLVVSFFAVCTSSFGQTKSLLYEVKKNGHQTSYLYGTIHLVPDSLFLFTKKLKKIISQSDEIIFEIVNMDDSQSLTSLLKQKDKNNLGNHFERGAFVSFLFFSKRKCGANTRAAENANMVCIEVRSVGKFKNASTK